MQRQTQPTQIFTVFGSYVLEGDYDPGENGRTSNQIRCEARKTEFDSALRQAEQA